MGVLSEELMIRLLILSFRRKASITSRIFTTIIAALRDYSPVVSVIDHVDNIRSILSLMTPHLRLETLDNSSLAFIHS